MCSFMPFVFGKVGEKKSKDFLKVLKFVSSVFMLHPGT